MKTVQKGQRRQLALFIIALAITLFIYWLLGFSPETWVDHDGLKAERALWRLSMGLANSALLFLAAALLIGPINLLRKRPNPTHNPLRRDVGIGAGILSIAHVLSGMHIHTSDWRIWRLWLSEWPSLDNPLPIRLGWFGLANYSGLLLLLLFIFLLSISNKRALKKFGLKQWKRLQQLTYLVLLLTAAHGFIYQTIEERILPNRLWFGGLLLLVALGQLIGFAWMRKQRLS